MFHHDGQCERVAEGDAFLVHARVDVDRLRLRRGQNDQDQPLREDYADAAGYYGQKTRETAETFKQGLNTMKDAVTNAWRNR